MSGNTLAFYAVIVVLFPLLCFFLSSPTFLLVPLNIPEVTKLLRGLFHAYFMVAAGAAALAAVIFVAAGKLLPAMGVVLVGVFAFYARRWFLTRIDSQIAARDAGNAGAVRELRRLHVRGMLVNFVQLAAVVSLVPLLPR
jgi:hypothetical protein